MAKDFSGSFPSYLKFKRGFWRVNSSIEDGFLLTDKGGGVGFINPLNPPCQGDNKISLASLYVLM